MKSDYVTPKDLLLIIGLVLAGILLIVLSMFNRVDMLEKQAHYYEKRYIAEQKRASEVEAKLTQCELPHIEIREDQ